MNGKQVCKKLENKGWGKEGRKPVPIPVHGKKDLGIGLLLKIEKETGVKLT